MSTGYGWEGIRQVRATAWCVPMYLSTSVVAVSTWGTITSARPFELSASGSKSSDMLALLLLVAVAVAAVVAVGG